MKKLLLLVLLIFGASRTTADVVMIENEAGAALIGQKTSFTVADFDAGSGSKLVVTVCGEGNGAPRVVSGITHGGVSLTEAVGYSDSVSGLQHVSIWYLDNPLQNGDIVITFDGLVNGIGMSALSLSGTAAGPPSAASSADGREVDIDVEFGSVSVAAFVANGGAAAAADTQLTQLYGGEIGSAQGAAGYEEVTASGPRTYTFSGGGSRPAVAAANFAAEPVEVSESGSTTLDVSLTADPNEGYPFTVTILAEDMDVIDITNAQGKYDLNVSQTTLVFNSLADVKTITLSGVDNDLLDGDRTHALMMSYANPIGIVDPNCQIVKILDDDIPYVILTDAESLEVAEGGIAGFDETDTFIVSVTQVPKAGNSITVDLDTDPNYLLLDTYQVAFTNTSAEPQVITVSAVDNDENDTAAIPYESYTRVITTTVNGADEITDPSVLIYENDCGAVEYNSYDIDTDCDVDIADFAEFAKEWLKCQIPNMGDDCPVMP